MFHYCSEMIRAGAVAKQVIDELKSLGVDIKTGATGALATTAKAAFAGRTLDSYYTKGEYQCLVLKYVDLLPY
jgi:hypothetical protein